MNEFKRRTSGVNRKCFDKHIATIEKSGRDISNLMDWIEATDFLSARSRIARFGEYDNCQGDQADASGNGNIDD